MAIYVRFASGTDGTSPCFAEDSIAQSRKSNKRLQQIFERDIVEAVNFQTFHAMLQCSLFGEGRAYNAIFLAGAAGDEFASLTDLQIEKYADYYAWSVQVW